MTRSIHYLGVDSVGVIIRVQVTEKSKAVPLTNAAVVWKWTRPDGTIVTKNAIIEDVAGGITKYISIAGDLDQEGYHSIKPEVTFTSPSRFFRGSDVILYVS